MKAPKTTKMGMTKTVTRKSKRGSSKTTSVDLAKRQYKNMRGNRRHKERMAKMDYKFNTAKQRASVQKTGMRSAAVTGTTANAVSEGEQTEREALRQSQKYNVISEDTTYKDNNRKIVDQSNGGIGGGGSSPLSDDNDSDFA